MRSIRSKLVEYREVEIVLDAGGNGAIAVSFEEAFRSPPQVLVIDDAADVAAGASYSASAVVFSGFTLVVASSKRTNTRQFVQFIAAERD